MDAVQQRAGFAQQFQQLIQQVAALLPNQLRQFDSVSMEMAAITATGVGAQLVQLYENPNLQQGKTATFYISVELLTVGVFILRGYLAQRERAMLQRLTPGMAPGQPPPPTGNALRQYDAQTKARREMIAMLQLSIILSASGMPYASHLAIMLSLFSVVHGFMHRAPQ